MKSFESPPGSMAVPTKTLNLFTVRSVLTPVPAIAPAIAASLNPAESYVWNMCNGAMDLILSGPPEPVVSLPLNKMSSDLPSIL